MAKHTIEELREWQALPLPIKILMTKERIRQWVNEYGIDGVYVSFSGGKDSTVLLHIARQMYPEIRGLFCDTGLEYPQIRDFVKSFDNIDWVKPKMTFRQIIDKYGYPFPTKEIATHIHNAHFAMEKGKDLSTHRGWLKLHDQFLTSDGKKSHYNCGKWEFMLDAPFDCTAQCCTISKKNPSKDYEHETGRKPIIGTLAEESKQREFVWTKQGCNAYDIERPVSTPMAFWTEQDVLHYIKENKEQMVQDRVANLEKIHGCKLEDIVDAKTGNAIYNRETIPPICSVYGDIVEVKDVDEEQLSIADCFSCCSQIDNTQTQELKTTGCDRTGCVFCLFGSHLPETPRFIELKKNQPQIYDFVFRPKEKGGLGYKEVIDWLNEHGKLDIKY